MPIPLTSTGLKTKTKKKDSTKQPALRTTFKTAENGHKLLQDVDVAKGQLISKADWQAIDSLKKRTDEFVFFAFLLFTANKSNSSVPFLGESMARQSAFEIN